MRTEYHGYLEGVGNDLVHLADDVALAVHEATAALLNADQTLAEQVISDDAKIDARTDDLEARCFTLLARQAPVAGELRTLVAALKMIADLGRAGDLAAHVAKIARLRYPEKAVPTALAENMQRMAEVAEEMVRQAAITLRDRNVIVARQLAENDEEMDELRRSQFRIVLGREWSHGVEAAVDTALLGRYYERISDHAVAVARRLIYLVTGEAPEGANWPTT